MRKKNLQSSKIIKIMVVTVSNECLKITHQMPFKDA